MAASGKAQVMKDAYVEAIAKEAGKEAMAEAGAAELSELAGKLGSEVGQQSSITMDAQSGMMRGVNDNKDSIRIVGTGVDDAKRSNKDLKSAGLGHIDSRNPYPQEGSYATHTHSMGNRLKGWMHSEVDEHRDWRRGVENRKATAARIGAGMKAFSDSYNQQMQMQEQRNRNQQMQQLNTNMRNFNRNFGYSY